MYRVTAAIKMPLQITTNDRNVNVMSQEDFAKIRANCYDSPAEHAGGDNDSVRFHKSSGYH